MKKVGRIADAHERFAGVDVILPAIEFLLVLEGKVEPLLFRLEEQTIRLEVGPLYFGNLLKVDSCGYGAVLGRMKI